MSTTRVVFYADGTTLEFEPTEVAERGDKAAVLRPLTGGRRARVVGAPSDSMRRSGKREWEMTFEGVPGHFKQVLERIRAFDLGGAGRTPVVMRTTFGQPETGQTVELVPNVADTPSGMAARTQFYFPQAGLMPGSLAIYRDGVEIEEDDGVTPYTPVTASGLVEFDAPVSEGYTITGAAEYAASGYIDDWQAQSLPGYATPTWTIRLVFREA